MRRVENAARIGLLGLTLGVGLAGCTRIQYTETPTITPPPSAETVPFSQEFRLRQGTTLPVTLRNVDSSLDVDSQAVEDLYRYFHEELPSLGIPLLLSQSGGPKETKLLITPSENPQGITHLIIVQPPNITMPYSQTTFEGEKPLHSFSRKGKVQPGSALERYGITDEGISSAYLAVEACMASLVVQASPEIKSVVCNQYGFAAAFRASGKDEASFFQFMRETGFEEAVAREYRMTLPITAEAWETLPTSLPLQKP